MSPEKISTNSNEESIDEGNQDTTSKSKFRIFSSEALREEFLGEARSSYNEDEEVYASHKYEYFNEEDRKHLFKAFKNAGEYIRQNNIADMVFIDRTARGGYIGIKEYLKHTYPGQPQPNIYFVNPRGFSMVYFNESPASLRMRNFATDEEKYERMDQRFSEVYPRLMEDKDKPVLLFDACIHRGATMLIVLLSLERLGFKQIKKGVYSKDNSYRGKVDIDFEMLPEEDPSCSPFDVDKLLVKNADVISKVSAFTTEEDFKKVAQIRGELVQIVRDGLGVK